MDKRLKEIVIYILENGSALQPEQRAELEELREQLDQRGISIEEIARAIGRAIESGSEGGSLRAFGRLLEAEIQEVELAPAAADYLRRIVQLGLISEEEEDELLIRAARLYPGGVELAQIQSLVATQLFDEHLGPSLSNLEYGERVEPRREH